MSDAIIKTLAICTMGMLIFYVSFGPENDYGSDENRGAAACGIGCYGNDCWSDSNIYSSAVWFSRVVTFNATESPNINGLSPGGPAIVDAGATTCTALNCPSTSGNPVPATGCVEPLLQSSTTKNTFCGAGT